MPEGSSRDPRAQGVARRQSAALPLLGAADSMRVVLVTSRDTRRWVVPKGWIESHEPPHRSAVREAFEEAGLHGEAEADPLGVYAYPKRFGSGAVVTTEVLVFRFRVSQLLEDWPERLERDRRLFTPDAAADLVAEPGLATLLRSLAGA